MSSEKAIYWIAQTIGWLFFVLLILFQNFVQNQLSAGIVKVMLVNFVLGVTLSHIMRGVMLHYKWLKLPIYKAFPRVIFISIFFGILATLLYASVSDVFFWDTRPILVYPFTLLLQLLFSYAPVFLFWNLLYFAAYYLKNYEKEEVKNLRLKAAMNEVELNNLKAQLNPHFMFNAMNSIRALVDEDPDQAKVSITQLSNILRNTLMVGKRKFLTIEEEIKVVENYLNLEGIRYEERLQVSFEIEPEVLSVKIPPLMIQTLAENGIKHGISKIPSGGFLRIAANLEDDHVLIEVENSGHFDPTSKSETGIGLSNTRKRLRLMYGQNASLEIFNRDKTVIAKVRIPNIRDRKRTSDAKPTIDVSNTPKS